jgi:hypothetical protein
MPLDEAIYNVPNMMYVGSRNDALRPRNASMLMLD